MDVWRNMLGGGWSRGGGLEISLEEEDFGLRACVLCAVGLRVDQIFFEVGTYGTVLSQLRTTEKFFGTDFGTSERSLMSSGHPPTATKSQPHRPMRYHGLIAFFAK